MLVTSLQERTQGVCLAVMADPFVSQVLSIKASKHQMLPLQAGL